MFGEIWRTDLLQHFLQFGELHVSSNVEDRCVRVIIWKSVVEQSHIY